MTGKQRSAAVRKAFNLLRREIDGQLKRSSFDYSSHVGTGLGSTVIVAPALWVARQFPEAKIAVKDQRTGELDYDHELVRLLNNPNPWYGGGAMKMALALDYTMTGNAYLEGERNARTRAPERLFYQPSFTIKPKGTKNELVTHYEHQTDSSVPRRVELEDMTQFRQGIDPSDNKLGLSPMRALLREVYTDDEASIMTAALLRNMGIMGLVISGASDEESLDEDDVGPIKRFFQRMFRGDNVGEPLVMSTPLRIDQPDIDLSKINIDKLRQIPEERVTAMLGIPAAVVGFGTGLEQTKVGATMKELRELAYENVIIPMQRVIGEEIDRSLLPEFEPDPERYTFVFDNSEVRVLQEDENRKSDRMVRLYQGGLFSRSEGREPLGVESKPSDEVYRQSFSDVLVPMTPPPEEPAAQSEASGAPGTRGANIQQTALNGAQIQSLTNTLLQVAQGILTTETARALLLAAFPSIEPTAIEAMLAGIQDIEPEQVRSAQDWVTKTLDIIAQSMKAEDSDLMRTARTLNSRMLREGDELAASWSTELEQEFQAWGDEAARLWLEAQTRLASRNGQRKADLPDDDRNIIDEVILSLGIVAPDYDAQYLRVLRRTHEGIEAVMGLGVMLDSPIEQVVLNAGGTRRGLVDFTEQTRQAMYEVIASARDEGLGPPAIARRIRDQIPAGPYLSSKTRAEVIAQAETKFAQNVSSMQVYMAAENVNGIIVFDAQRGSVHDPRCIELEQARLDGRVWTIEEAAAIEPTQHPQCSRSFAGVVRAPVEA